MLVIGASSTPPLFVFSDILLSILRRTNVSITFLIYEVEQTVELCMHLLIRVEILSGERTFHLYRLIKVIMLRSNIEWTRWHPPYSCEYILIIIWNNAYVTFSFIYTTLIIINLICRGQKLFFLVFFILFLYKKNIINHIIING